MSSWAKVILYVLLTLFLGFILRELGFKGSKLLLLLGTVSVIGASVIGVGELVSLMPDISEEADEYVVTILKIVGVGYVFGICSELCTELGEAGVGRALSLAGRVEILLLVMPYFVKTISLGMELIG